MNVYIGKERLPSAYQEVEYIQSNGNQIIDTGVYGNGNTSILTKMVVTGRKGNYDMYYGAYMDGGTGAFFIQSNYPDNNKLRVVNYSNDGSTKKYVDSINDLQFNTEYIIEHTNTKFIINGTLQGTMTSSSFTTSRTLCVFGFHNKTGTLEPRLIGKIYYFKIYDNGTLVRNFIPCYRKSDSVIGLYDIVNNQFYTNAGTGAFSKGNDVTMSELKNAYIGEYVEEVYTIASSSIPNDNSNVYKSIAKSGYTIQSVTIEISADNNGITTSTYRTAFCRLSGSTNTTHRYGLGFFFYDVGNENTLKIAGRKDNNSDVTFQTGPSLSSNGYNNAILTINRDGATRTVGGVSYSRTYTDAEKNIVETILNTGTTNFYVSRVGGVTVSDTVARVRYSKN